MQNKTAALLAAILLIIFALSACSPCDPAPELEHPIQHGAFEHAGAEDITLEVVSDSEVRVSYVRDGQLVVETYRVTRAEVVEKNEYYNPSSDETR